MTMLTQILIALFSIVATSSGSCPANFQSRMMSCGAGIDSLMTAETGERRQHCSTAERGLNCLRELITNCRESHPTEIGQLEAGIAYIDSHFELYCSTPVHASAECPGNYRTIMNASITSSREIMHRIYGGVSLTTEQCNQLEEDLDNLEMIYESCRDRPDVRETAESIPVGIMRFMGRRSQCPNF